MDIINTCYFLEEGKLKRGDLSYEMDAMNPLMEWDHIGALYSWEGSIGDVNMSTHGNMSEWIYEEVEEKKGISREELDKLSVYEVLKLFRELYLLVVPVKFFDMWSKGVDLFVDKEFDIIDDKYIDNENMILIEKDNREALDIIQNEGKDRLFEIIEDDIKVYKDYMNGNVYHLDVYYWDYKTEDWIFEEAHSDVYDVMSAIEAADEFSTEPQLKALDYDEARILKLSITPNRLKEFEEELVEEVRLALPKFDHIFKYACISVLENNHKDSWNKLSETYFKYCNDFKDKITLIERAFKENKR